MAQRVGYFENNVIYTEGPFVMTEALYPDYRIEVEIKGHMCPAFPDLSIYELLEMEGIDWHKGKAEKIAPVVDWLNQKVREGIITLQGNIWRV